jgi:glycosyltransferase involved in cell wall biosynthesis
MCQAFITNGAETELICMSSGPSNKIFDFYGVNPFKISILKESGKLFFFLKLIFLFLKKKRDEKLLYTRSPIIALLATFFFKKVAYESHLIPSDFLNRAAERIILGKDRIYLICISQALKDDYLILYPEKELKILVAHDGADLPERINEIRLEVKTIGYIGQLYAGKGINIVLELSKKFSDIEFLILGGTHAEIEFLKSRHKLLPNVQFKGHVPHKDIQQWSSLFDIALAPIQEKNILKDGKTDIGKWTSPLKIFEYLSSGIPMIASDLAVIQEIVVDKKEALLCPASNLESWQAAIIELKNVKLRQSISSEGYKRFKAEYTWTERAKKTLIFLS